MVEITIRPDGGENAVDLRVGDVLAVEVLENRTTGYLWSVVAMPGMLAELPSEGAGAGADVDAGSAPGSPSGPPRPGATGRRTLRFAAEQPGVGELRLGHGRPWQPAGGEEVTIAVRVESVS